MTRAEIVYLYAAGSLREINLATSTPRSDPSGDCAFEVFARAETIRPGARAALELKALQLTGAAGSQPPPAGRSVYGWHVAEGRADIFLTYCNGHWSPCGKIRGSSRSRCRTISPSAPITV